MTKAGSGRQAILHDTPIAYLPRIRSYYEALGYPTAYEWAKFDQVPFHRPAKPMASSRVAIVTTAAPYQQAKGDQGPGAPYNAAAKFYTVYSMDSAVDPDLRISHLSIDRAHTTAEDMGTYFPLRALRRLRDQGMVGSIAARFHGAPTNRSRRTTMDVDCAEIVRRCREDAVDAVILVPNCPVCHQTVSLMARRLEEEEIATVVLGCARDIVEHVGVPRLVFSDFPLGNAAGRPGDPASQLSTLGLALELLGSATEPRTTVQSPQQWSTESTWKRDYMNASLLTPAEIAEKRKAFDREREVAREIREGGPAPA